MKYFKSKIFSLLLIASGLLACEDDTEKVTFKGSSAPVLTLSSTDELVLEKSKEGYSSLQFQWTNPEYQFSNGINTQDIYYTLEIDTAGSNFSNPKKVALGFTNENKRSFTVKEFNNTISGLELKDYVPHDFEFRIKATLASGSVPTYSNVVAIRATTYLDVLYPVPDKLYITGAATPGNWMGGGDAPLESQEFEKINTYTFQLADIELNATSGFLLVPVYGNWDNKYGFDGEKEKNNPNGDKFKPNGNDFISPGTKAHYKITVNFKTGRYSLEKL